MIMKTIQGPPIPSTKAIRKVLARTTIPKKSKIKNKANITRKSTPRGAESLAMNPYLCSLLDPFNHIGARIPDLVTFPSIPLSVVHRQTLTVNGQGIAGMTFGIGASGGSSQIASGSLVPVLSIIAAADYYPIATILSSTAAITNIFTGVVAPTNWAQLLSFQTGNFSIPNAFKQMRLVSAAFNIQFTGATLSDAGKMTLAFAPRNTIKAEMASSISSIFTITLDRIAQLPGARIIPVNIKTGGTVLYKPLDNVSLEYANISQTDFDTGVSSLEDWETRLAMYSGGEIFLLVDGAVPSQTFQVTSVFNYEAIPNTNSFNLVNAKPSNSDPIALSHAINVTAVTPSVVASSKEELGISTGIKQLGASDMKVHEIKNTPSMLDRVLGGITSFAEGSSKVANVVGSAAMTLAPLAMKFASFL